jgi:hypothetical protein
VLKAQQELPVLKVLQVLPEPQALLDLKVLQVLQDQQEHREQQVPQE